MVLGDRRNVWWATPEGGPDTGRASRVNTNERDSTAKHSSNQAAHLRLYRGVPDETKEHLRPLLTRPSSLEMADYPNYTKENAARLRSRAMCPRLRMHGCSNDTVQRRLKFALAT